MRGATTPNGEKRERKTMHNKTITQLLIENYPELFSPPHEGYNECRECGGHNGLVYVNSEGYDIHPQCLDADVGILEEERAAYYRIIEPAQTPPTDDN